MINRRHLLIGAASGLAAPAGPATAQPIAPRRLPPLRPGEWLRTPNFSLLAEDPWRVGLRPHREGGVRLEVEHAPEFHAARKVLIHNYGHSGAGITLAWGCADRVVTLATGELRDTLQKDPMQARFAIIGAGIAGLTVADEIKRTWPRADVDIVASSIAGNGRPQLNETTSWIAGGHFEPAGLWQQYVATATRPDRTAALHDLVRRSYRRILTLRRQGKAAGYGIIERRTYILDGQDTGGFEIGMPRDVAGPGRHGMMPFRPLQDVSGKEYRSWLINPTILMPRLIADLGAAGARFAHRTILSRGDLLAIDADVIINCTGLGARKILDVQDVHARRGQLVALKNPDQIRFMLSGGCGDETAYLFGRQEDIIIGGTFHDCETTAGLAEESYRTLLRRMQRIFAGDISGCRVAPPATPPVACVR